MFPFDEPPKKRNTTKFPITPMPEGVRHPGLNKRGPKGNRRGPPKKYPFEDLEVGQSFLAPLKLRKTLSALAVYHGKKMGRLFAVVQLAYDEKKIAVCRTR
jgi:hypothetical protein